MKPNSYEIRNADDGSLDEVVATGADVHLEQMHDGCWMLIVSAGGREVHVSLRSRGKGKATVDEFRVRDNEVLQR